MRRCVSWISPWEDVDGGVDVDVDGTEVRSLGDFESTTRGAVRSSLVFSVLDTDECCS